jgi:hypothetical protein
MPFDIRSAEDISPAQLHAAFTAAFSDYLIGSTPAWKWIARCPCK